ncbi:MotA/TolQ/ExbB proton channel family protein [Candidatus Nitrosacidococcus sp. I8]|uniref:MotA/TolQ/ExbB proton channel family protein n=1 Tax=Candidatus Nitrosacidococcus sp. I8 TaxID=2942908 RepID=UPI002226BC43|nr:MotA/TolQ/ExbB proton channel family protein [Candidatus Nitrosacidococcus sp. I8]CAH9019722.1 Tol-Pal system protein TolQ [Candidatus Nitrosacidococcus sp. I8]
MGMFSDGLFKINSFLAQGGSVLWLILVTSFFMWMLIIERYYFLFILHPARLQQLVSLWEQLPKHRSWHAQKIREGMIADITNHLKQFLLLIKSLTAVLPMLGLLGTVIGMIEVFDVMTVSGTGNTRGFAGGISTALITTLAGLVTSLSGVYFSADLEHRVDRTIEQTMDLLR